MCGLAGCWRSDWDVAEALERISHRGPDFLDWTDAGDALLGHVRLSIMDPEPRSHQPFIYGDITLTYNGELWNYQQLRARLEEEGADFMTTGDTEVVAAMLHRHGPLALGSMDGQFALAWTDHRDGSTWLARDRYGEVPLYVLRRDSADLFNQSGGLMWASERKAFGDKLGAEADPVPAGTVWKLGEGPEPYAALPQRVMESGVDAAGVLNLIRAAVDRRLMSDVPVCFMSSGGLDSSLILRLVLERRPDVVAYTAVMDEASVDLDAARRVCAELGVELREVPVPGPTEATIRAALWAIETPMKAQVEIAHPCLYLAAAMAADGFKVVLSGEGADELFGGYGNLIRHSQTDRKWVDVRRESVAKMARGNFLRVNKSLMAHGVEGRLPFVDRDLIEAVLPLGVKACPPGKGLLKEASRGLVPEWVIDRKKATFQGAAGMSAATDEMYRGGQVKAYNRIARELFGGLPRG